VGAATQGSRKIDYTFLSRFHFGMPIYGEGYPVEVFDLGECSGHECSDHLMISSTVEARHTTTAYGQLTNGNSGKCLIVRGSATGTQARQYTCGTPTDQFWRFEHQGDGTYLLRNQSSGQCLVARGTAENAPVVQDTCDAGLGDQRWTVQFGFEGITLRNEGSRKCLVVRGTANEAPAVQSSCNDGEWEQQWWFE
jgi:hypothetical protein